MSEQEMRNPETGANVPSEEIEMQPAQPEWDADKENSPAEPKTQAAKPVKKAKKKKKKNRVPVQVAVILAAVGLIFGVILGYTMGRSSANDEIASLWQQLTEANQPQDVVSEEPEEDPETENEAALAELSGESLMGDESELTMAEAFLQDSDEEVPAEEDGPVVVAEFNGGQLTSDEVIAEYNDQLTTYMFAGYAEDEIAGTLLDEVLRYMAGDKILEAKAREMGLYEINADDQERIAAQAQRDYAEQVEFYESFVYEEGMSDAEVSAAAQAYLLEMEGVTLQTIQAEIEEGWWMQKLYDEMVKDVTVESSDILAAYNEKLDLQKETFTAYPEDFELASINGEPILYNLENYRAVRMLLLPFESADATIAVSDIAMEISELNPETDSQQIEGLQAQLDAYYASAEETAQQVLSQLQSGADFNTMLNQYGEDLGMKDAAIREQGYYVSANSTIWNQSMIDAAMALEQAGDISGLVRTDEGVCILQYVGEVQPGTVDMAKIYDAVSAEILEEKQYQAYENQVNVWLADAGVQYYPERMQ